MILTTSNAIGSRLLRAVGAACLLATACLLAVPAHAQDDNELPPVTVVNKDGRTFEGELVRQTPTAIVLRIAGIETPFDLDNVDTFTVGKTVSEEYQERRAALDQADPEAWYQIAYFLFDRGRLDQAAAEVNALLQRHPNDTPARRLKALVESRQLLEQQRVVEPSATSGGARSQGTASGQVDGFEPQPAQEANYWLTGQEVSLVRLWELPDNLSEAQPSVVVPRPVVDQLFERYPDDPALPRGRDARNRFRGQPGWQQLQTMFQLRARDLYAEVQVNRDPEVLQSFRSQMNPGYVVGYFREHFGSGQMPGLYLLRYRPNAAESAFANLVILSTATHDGQPFIDRSAPAQSLLLQWGLPRDVASAPAPDVANWRPFFTGTEDPRFQDFVAIIDALYEPTPDYGFDYTLPTLDAVLRAEPAAGVAR